MTYRPAAAPRSHGPAVRPLHHRPAPPFSHSYTQLFTGPFLAVGDHRCAGHDGLPRDEWSSSYEIVVARRGAFVRLVAGTAVFVDALTASFWRPGETYRVRHPVAGGDDCSVFRYSEAQIREALAEFDREAAEAGIVRFPALAAHLDGPGYLRHCLAFRAASDPGASGLEVEERALGFLRAALAAARGRRSGAAGALPGDRGGEYVARVREVLAARYHAPLSLTEVAVAVGCSPFHLTRLVATSEGAPIHRLLVRRRLREGLERLLDTRHGVSRIAQDVGFSSHSHFSQAFRREFGITPRGVRSLPRRRLAVLTETARIR